MDYEKPQVIEVGTGEGVYTASGVCDCFTIENIREVPNAGFGGYYLEFEIHHQAEHSHTVEVDWADLYVEAVFEQDLTGLTVQEANATISGNKVILELATVIPAYAGDFSYNTIRFKGEGSGNVRYTSIEAKHH